MSHEGLTPKKVQVKGKNGVHFQTYWVKGENDGLRKLRQAKAAASAKYSLSHIEFGEHKIAAPKFTTLERAQSYASHDKKMWVVSKGDDHRVVRPIDAEKLHNALGYTITNSTHR